MASKPDHHHRSSRRLMLVLYSTCVLGIGFAAAFLCLSSTKPSLSSVSSIWVPENPPEIQAPSIDSRIIQKVSVDPSCKNDDFLSWVLKVFSFFSHREANNRTRQKMSVYYRRHLPIYRRRSYNGSKCSQLQFLDLTDTPCKSKTFCMSSPATAVSTT